MTVPEPPGSAAILAASGAGETPALPGKAGSEVRDSAFFFKMRIAEVSARPHKARVRGLLGKDTVRSHAKASRVVFPGLPLLHLRQSGFGLMSIA